MRLNSNTKIIGKKVILVPYEAKHVKKYHEWMKDPNLQELTASEPLSLEQEYEMQKSWRNDEDKCTFLILDRKTYEESDCNEIDALVGDTNLFLREDEETHEKTAEVEIMIADVTARGKGLGWESMLLLLKYGQLHLDITKYESKIGCNNTNSLNMFRKMHFKEKSFSKIFKEHTLVCDVTKDWMHWLNSQVTLVSEDYQ